MVRRENLFTTDRLKSYIDCVCILIK